MGSADEAPIELSLANVKGDNKLRVQVKKAEGSDFYTTAKVMFDLPKLVGEKNTGKVDHIAVDFTCIARGEYQLDDGTAKPVVGVFNGAIGGNYASASEDNPNWFQQEFQFEDKEYTIANWHFETKSPQSDAQKFADNDKGVSLVIMRFEQPNDVDFYIDNLIIYDKEGKSLPIILDVTVDKADVVEEPDFYEYDPEVDDLDLKPSSSEDQEESTAEPDESSTPKYDSDGYEIL